MTRDKRQGVPLDEFPQDMLNLISQGYRCVSRKFGIVARIDRQDWKQVMADKGYVLSSSRDFPSNIGSMADQYRRCYSEDKVEVEPQYRQHWPTSNHDDTGYCIKPGEEFTAPPPDDPVYEQPPPGPETPIGFALQQLEPGDKLAFMRLETWEAHKRLVRALLDRFEPHRDLLVGHADAIATFIDMEDAKPPRGIGLDEYLDSIINP